MVFDEGKSIAKNNRQVNYVQYLKRNKTYDLEAVNRRLAIEIFQSIFQFHSLLTHDYISSLHQSFHQ
jgi:hypothetical protein